MDLYKEILASVLSKSEMRVTFPDLKADAKEIVETESYQALQKIKEVLGDDSLTDKECFMKIEEIICIFEAMGCNVGNRHDFG
ncbi:MAG: hypothetical protein PUB00_05145 [Clostridiales bacterium]|nr:hypothetical protein [Clostridiales bacterium]